MKFTAEQKDAITAMRPLVCVSAGAGSGKTSILIERIAHLLESPDVWPDGRPQLEAIAAITFTEKAAAEMKARLRAKFRAKPAQDDPAGMRFWREMERQVEGARITTIHAFCAAILREHALHIGMDPEWSVPNEAEAAQLAERVVMETLHRLLEADDAAAKRLSLYFNRNEVRQMLLEALAMRERIEEQDPAPWQQGPEALAAWWTRHLPEVHEAGIREIGCIPEVSMLLEGLHACEEGCQNPMDKMELRRLAYINVLEEIRARKPGMAARVAQVLKEHKGVRASKKNWDEEVLNEAREWLKKTKDFFDKHFIPPRWDPDFDALAAQLTCDFQAVCREALHASARARRAMAMVDFEDMITATLHLLRSTPTLCARIAHSMRFLLIDEFQDTDARQLAIATLLTRVKGGPDLFVVGDAKQSIYYFRGADVELFRHTLGQDQNHVLLSKNFRSLPDVLYFVNDFFADSRLLDAVEQYRPMEAPRPAVKAPQVEIFAPHDEEDEKRDNAQTKRERDALFVARRIRELCDPQAPLLLPKQNGDTPRPATYDDIVLLFRRGSYMHSYEAALREANIPYNRVSGAGFFQCREVLDILALLHLIQDPWDEDALLTVLRSPLAGLSDETLMRLVHWGGSLAAAFHRDGTPEHCDQPQDIDTARALFNALYPCREFTPGTLLRRILKHTGYEAVVLSQYLGLQKVSNLRKIIQMADDYTRSGGAATAAEFTRHVQEITVRDIREGEATLQAKGLGAVTLMSIHKAKGLEFPVVFMPEMYIAHRGKATHIVGHHPVLGVTVKAPDAEGSITDGAVGVMSAKIRALAETAEMARILYVAMTRACDYLVLCGHANPAKGSWAESLNNTLALDERNEGACISGQGWQAVLKRHVPEAPRPEKIPEKPAQPDTEAMATAIAPVFATPAQRDALSVSHLLYLMEDSGTSELLDIEPDPTPPTDPSHDAAEAASRAFAMTRGNLVHRLFELWDFRSDTPPDLEELIHTAQLGLQHHQQMKEQLGRMITRLRDADLWPQFHGAAAILREVPFLLDIGPVLVRGVIDAVVDERLVVDYKTGKPTPELNQRYETQLLLYAAALKTLRGHAPDTGILWYADHGITHSLAITDAAIEKTLTRARNVFRAS